MDGIIEIGEMNFEAEVLGSPVPVLAVFLSPGSRPCKILEGELNEIAASAAGKIKLVKVNADNCPVLGLMFKVQFVPTLLCFIDGKVRFTIVGTATSETILSRMSMVFPRQGGAAGNVQKIE
jgi:thioredoxin-like negative regulator of GroEL